MRREKALYFFVGSSSFTEKDLKILKEEYDVLEFNFEFGQKWKTPFQLLNQFFFLLRYLPSAKFSLIQLAGFHSWLPAVLSKLFGKKCFIVAAGTDAHNFPSIGYGNYRKKLLAYFTRSSFRMCTHILPKDETLWHTKYTYDPAGAPAQGIREFVPGITTGHSVIPNGYDATLFNAGTAVREKDFITVSGLLNRSSQHALKGIDLIIRAAAGFPDKSFTIVGVNDPNSFPSVSSNVTLLPSIKNSELPELYSQHKFYLQLSMAEGFPNALCEAMLCECVPIGSDVFSIPEIIGQSGFILKSRSDNELKTLLSKAIQSDISPLGKAARKRVSDNYTIENRQTKLLDFLRKNS